jgi:hypothetical protein
MDDRAEEFLTNAKLPGVTVIRLTDIETPDLLRAKSNRTLQEYCWTCTPAIIRYCLNTYSLDHCTYLDADIYFFNNPELLLKELGGNSVIITPHNYHPDYDQSATSGTYCVQFLTFDNTKEARAVLETWYHNCISWCFARVEDGKFGDQKYLDTWPTDYSCVKVCQNHGGGVAPWNISRYDILDTYEKIRIKDIHEGIEYPLIFYHFHDFCFNKDGLWHHRSGPNGYRISEIAYHHIYKPYLRELYEIGKQVKFAEPTDLPKIPQFFTREDFETTFLGRTANQSDREFLRSTYKLIQGQYVLDTENRMVEDRIFDLLLKANLNLSRETIWHFNENLAYASIMAQQRKLDDLEQTWLFKLARFIYRKMR